MSIKPNNFERTAGGFDDFMRKIKSDFYADNEKMLAGYAKISHTKHAPEGKVKTVKL